MKKITLLASLTAAGLLAAAAYGVALYRSLPALPFTFIFAEPEPEPEPEAAWQWNVPAHFPPPHVPPNNPMSESKFQLGRHLFYDARLSGNGTQACASCHFQHLAFTDGKAHSTGSTGMSTLRSAQGLANSVYHPFLTWANFSLVTLEGQMMTPLLGESPVEMGLNQQTLPLVLQRLKAAEPYPALFAQAFPDEPEPVRLDNVVKAVAVFQRGLISANSRYDQALRQQVRLTADEARGQALFFSAKAQCAQCHGSHNFNDQVITALSADLPAMLKTPFHNTGLYNLDGQGAFPPDNPGLFELSEQPEDMGRFRAPSLRNVAVTAPYMHDGSLKTLPDVLDFYAAHGRVVTHGPQRGDGRRSPLKDPRIDRIDLSAQDKADLVAFLRALTDEEFLTNPRFGDPLLPPPARP